MEELKVVNCCIDLFEKDMDPRHLVEIYDELERDHVALKLKHEETQFIHESKLKKANSLYKDAMNKL